MPAVHRDDPISRVPDRPYTVRPIRAEEVEPALEVWLAANLARGVDSEDDHLAIVRRQLETTSDVALIAVGARQVLGFVTGEPRRVDDLDVAGAMQLQALFVSPDQQGRGVGSALLRAFLAEAAHRGRPEVHLWVRTENAGARGLYERQGFVAGPTELMAGGVSITAYVRAATAADLDA